MRAITIVQANCFVKSRPASGKGRVFVWHTKFPFVNICSIYCSIHSSIYPPCTGSCEKRPPVDVHIVTYGEHSPNLSKAGFHLSIWIGH